MKILVIGSGGREHALAWKLAREGHRVYGAPGNPGIAEEGEIVSTTDYLGIAEKIDPDLTVVGPEGPLAEGIVDRFRGARRRIVGPNQENARLEAARSIRRRSCSGWGFLPLRFVRAEGAEESLSGATPTTPAQGTMHPTGNHDHWREGCRRLKELRILQVCPEPGAHKPLACRLILWSKVEQPVLDGVLSAFSARSFLRAAMKGIGRQPEGQLPGSASNWLELALQLRVTRLGPPRPVGAA